MQLTVFPQSHSLFLSLAVAVFFTCNRLVHPSSMQFANAGGEKKMQSPRILQGLSTFLDQVGTV